MLNRLLLMTGLICLLYSLPVPALTGTSPTASSSVSSADAHAALQRVLSRGEFRDNLTSRTEKQESWLQKYLKSLQEKINGFFKKIDDFLKRIFPRSESSGEREKGISTAWRFILYVDIAAIIVFLLGLMVSRIWSERRLSMTSDNSDMLEEDAPVKQKQEPSYWDRSILQAGEQWEAGNQREAIRTLQRACLVLLDARGVLRYQVSRANGEVLRELRRQEKISAQQALRPIVGSFDRSWYGFLQLSNEEFSAALESSRHFRKAVTEERDA